MNSDLDGSQCFLFPIGACHIVSSMPFLQARDEQPIVCHRLSKVRQPPAQLSVSASSLVLWCSGALVLWCFGALELRCSGSQPLCPARPRLPTSPSHISCPAKAPASARLPLMPPNSRSLTHPVGLRSFSTLSPPECIISLPLPTPRFSVSSISPLCYLSHRGSISTCLSPWANPALSRNHTFVTISCGICSK